MTIEGSTIKAFRRGINFVPLNNESELTVNNTIIQNPNLDDYNTETVSVNDDTRGISLGNANMSTVELIGVAIYGYSIALNNTGSTNYEGIYDSYGSYVIINDCNFISSIVINNWASNITYDVYNSSFTSVNNIDNDYASLIMNNATSSDYNELVTLNFTESSFIYNKINGYGGGIIFLPQYSDFFYINFNGNNVVQYVSSDIVVFKYYVFNNLDAWINNNLSGIQNINVSDSSYSNVAIFGTYNNALLYGSRI